MFFPYNPINIEIKLDEYKQNGKSLTKKVQENISLLEDVIEWDKTNLKIYRKQTDLFSSRREFELSLTLKNVRKQNNIDMLIGNIFSNTQYRITIDPKNLKNLLTTIRKNK